MPRQNARASRKGGREGQGQGKGRGRNGKSAGAGGGRREALRKHAACREGKSARQWDPAPVFFTTPHVLLSATMSPLCRLVSRRLVAHSRHAIAAVQRPSARGGSTGWNPLTQRAKHKTLATPCMLFTNHANATPRCLRAMHMPCHAICPGKGMVEEDEKL